ncbi:MAG: acyl-CoA dehydrogenase family protein, partial [Polyangiaceae bacterium]|nr:acyl-CoA dehydrogenase family protein [Polyangiaceae bacterium]
MRSLFFGVIEEGLVFPWPRPPAGEVDALHGVLDGMRRFLDEKVDSSAIDRQGRIPDEVIRGLKKMGAFGWLVPRSYGGTGLSRTGYARVIEEMASRDSSLAVTLDAHQSLGIRGIVGFGSNAVRSRFLPRLATGELVAAFALTERGAGSDAASIQMRAESDGNGDYILRGSKLWVTNGGFANLFTVFARTSPAEEGVKPRITAFVLEKGPGVESGPDEPKLGIRGTSTAEVRFDGVRVPAENVLGEAGRGHRVAMDVLNGGRIGLASGCLGICKRVIQMAIARCQDRRAFGRPIGEFGLIKDKIASMLADTWALESALYLTTGMIDAGAPDFAIESAICKVYGSETCWRVVNEAMQIAAGMGYMEGSGYERILRDARVNLVFEGTNEILRAFIALSGMQGPGRARADVARAMREPIKGFGLLGDFAIRRARSAFGRARLTRHHPLLHREAAVVEQYTHDLARGVDKALRMHGRDIAEMQYTQKRAADIAIDLYASTACIARASDKIERRGEEGARRAIDFTSIFVASAERRMASTVAAIDKNDDELRKAV